MGIKLTWAQQIKMDFGHELTAMAIMVKIKFSTHFNSIFLITPQSRQILLC